MQGPFFLRLDGNRIRMTHGPLEVVMSCEGPDEQCELVYGRGWKRFQRMLEEFNTERDSLREPLGEEPPALEGKTALRMLAAAWPFRARGIAPAAAAAGAIVEDIMEAMLPAIPLRIASAEAAGRAALWLFEEEKLVIDRPGLPGWPAPACIVSIKGDDISRGLASARGPEAMPLVVTALAARAAEADLAAAMIAAIAGRAATAREALDRGEAEARLLVDAGIIHGAALLLRGETRVIGGREKLLPHRAAPIPIEERKT